MASERSRVEEEKEDPHAGSREGVKGDLLNTKGEANGNTEN